MTCPTGVACIRASTDGVGTAPWTQSTRHFGIRCARRPDKKFLPQRAAWTAKAPRAHLKGHSCLLGRGYDGAKRLCGRKRFVLADVLNCFLEVEVVPASAPERAGAETLFWRLKGQEVAHKVQQVWADGGFEGKQWQKTMHEQFGFHVEIVKRSDDVKGLCVLPKRWVVKRSFGWMN